MKNYKFKNRKSHKGNAIFVAILLIISLFVAYKEYNTISFVKPAEELSKGNIHIASEDGAGDRSLSSIPEYDGSPVFLINNNYPTFTDKEYSEAEEMYIELSELDKYGRTGVCKGSLAEDTMPTTDRGDISSVHPAGWVQAKYPDLISYNGGYLYNRGHLIMRALSGLEADARNLATLTVYCNEEGMLPYETAVCNYIEKRGGRILYRVTPVYKSRELVPRGIHIEAGDVKSKGEKFHINIYCYNVQPGIEIDYLTGKSKRK